MKILKKVRIRPCECKECGTIFLPRRRDIRAGTGAMELPLARCPMCKVANLVRFEKEGAEKIENG